MKLLGFGRNDKRREKDRRRRAAFDDPGAWVRDGQFARRVYANYQEYLDHQAAKLDIIRERLERKEGEKLAEFRRRFEGCAPLREARSVLCLGARLGTEVQALHQLGYFAVGVDLNPGPDNRWVLPGDFHHLVFPDGSVDAVYTNALDHAFELTALMSEIARVLRPGGLFITDFVLGFEEGFIPGKFEAFHWREGDALIRTIRDLTGFTLVEQRDLGPFRRHVFQQAVLRRANATPPVEDR